MLPHAIGAINRDTSSPIVPLARRTKEKTRNGEASDAIDMSKHRRSFKRGMLMREATWGETEAEEMSSSEDESSDPEMQKGICFMAIGDNEVDSEPYVDDGLYWIGDESFPSMKEAFDHLLLLYREMLAELKSNKKKIKHLRRDVEYEQDQKEEIKIKLFESRSSWIAMTQLFLIPWKLSLGKLRKRLLA